MVNSNCNTGIFQLEYENSLYTLIDQSGDISLYQCNASLPFGYVAPEGFDLPEDDGNQGLRLQNRMVRELGVDGALFVKCERSVSGDDIVFTAKEEGYYYEEESGNSVSFSVQWMDLASIRFRSICRSLGATFRIT